MPPIPGTPQDKKTCLKKRLTEVKDLLDEEYIRSVELIDYVRREIDEKFD
jgi:hypothetical protein